MREGFTDHVSFLFHMIHTWIASNEAQEFQQINGYIVLLRVKEKEGKTLNRK